MNWQSLSPELRILNLRLLREIKIGHRRSRFSRSNVLMRFHTNVCDLVNFLLGKENSEVLLVNEIQDAETFVDKLRDKESKALQDKEARALLDRELKALNEQIEEREETLRSKKEKSAPDMENSSLDEEKKFSSDAEHSQLGKKEESSDMGAASLSFLVRSFSLTRFEQFCLIVCLAPEIDPNYGKIYAYLQDEFNRRQPTVDLILRLFCPGEQKCLSKYRSEDTTDAPTRDTTTQEREMFSHLNTLAYLNTTATLRANRLVQFVEAADTRIPLTARTLVLDDRIAAYLLGISQSDHYLDNWVEIVAPGDTEQPPTEEKNTTSAITAASTTASNDTPTDAFEEDSEYLQQREKLQARTASFVKSCFREDGAKCGAVIHFYGQDGVGHRSLAQYACNKLKRALMVADLQRLMGGGMPHRGEALWRLAREAFLRGAVIYVENIDELLLDERSTEFNLFFDAIECFSRVTFLSGHSPWRGSSPLRGHRFVSRECPTPSAQARAALWRTALVAGKFDITDLQCKELASTFILTESQINNVVQTVEDEIWWEEPLEKKVRIDFLLKACRDQATANLGNLAHRIEPSFKREDIVLPANQLEQIDELVSHVKHSICVLEEWGFAQKLPYGRGVTALFEGPSGTGKTMAAEIIARELGVDLYKIDLSAVVSKYIGETEKNLSRIFVEARATNAILFFDEGDALFGKRSSDVKDAHDRYANIEVAYLLQQIENHCGVVILATNLKQNLDEAFIRRMRFIVHFPFPNEADRENIWQKVFPEKRISREVDYRWLARRLKLTGGNIKNVALRAAYRAAARTSPEDVITMTDIVEAAKRELDKMGRVYTDDDFSPWGQSRKTLKQEAA